MSQGKVNRAVFILVSEYGYVPSIAIQQVELYNAGVRGRALTDETVAVCRRIEAEGVRRVA
jgi:hypothetical protein